MTDYTPAKPIEPGCKVIIWRQPTFAKRWPTCEGTALFQTVLDAFIPGAPAWRVDFQGDVRYVATHLLLRIDDPDIQKEIERKREKEHV